LTSAIGPLAPQQSSLFVATMHRSARLSMNEDILAALKAVIDPELGINIVDLGLVY
jgi:hypothetical protein